MLFAGGFTGWGFAAFDCGLGVWIFGCFGYLVFWVLLVVGGLVLRCSGRDVCLLVVDW